MDLILIIVEGTEVVLKVMLIIVIFMTIIAETKMSSSLHIVLMTNIIVVLDEGWKDGYLE